MTRANVVELLVPTVKILGPSTTTPLVAPVRSWMVWLPPSEMSKRPLTMLTPLLAAIEPPRRVRGQPLNSSRDRGDATADASDPHRRQSRPLARFGSRSPAYPRWRCGAQ